MQWAAGIQTCPRQGIDLPLTLHRIHNGGWDDVFVFGEPGIVIPEGYKGLVWPYQTGDWGGWYAALSFLHATRPHVDYYVMFEDDITICKNVRQYVEYWVHECRNLGAICLYTTAHHHRSLGQKPVVTDESCHGWRVWGAQVVIFSRLSLRRFLCSPHILNFRESDIGIANAHKDALLGIWSEDERLGLYYHTPSLVEHLHLTSLIGSDGHQATEFVGEEFDPCSWGRLPEVCSYHAQAIPQI